MTTREEALNFGLSFPNTYQSAPFHDENWQLVRVKGSKKVFLWTYERNGFINLNVKVNDEWRDFWRDAFESVIRGGIRIRKTGTLSFLTAQFLTRILKG
mgnify:CR=1 FL=1